MKWLRRLFHGDYTKGGFAKWACSDLQPERHHVQTGNVVQDVRARNVGVESKEQIEERVLQQFQAHLLSDEKVSLQLSEWDGPISGVVFEGHSQIAKTITISGVLSADLVGGRYNRIGIHTHPHSHIVLSDCLIHTLQIGSGKNCGRVTIENCKIGTLSFTGICSSAINVKGGEVLNFKVPNPQQENPFGDSVSFDGVKIPRSVNGVPLTGAQPYRNMRAHLNELHNTNVAAMFHTAEQAVDLESDVSLWNRLFGYFYWGASDFGSSPGRPLIWLLLLSLLSMTLLGSMDGAVVLGDCEEPMGWYSTLCGEDSWASLARGFVMGFQPISFLGALLRTGSGYSLIAANVWVQAWLVFQGILSGVLLTLFILALRRRFKLGP